MLKQRWRLNLQVSLVIKATTAGELETGHVVLTPLGAAGGYSAADVLILTTRGSTLVAGERNGGSVYHIHGVAKLVLLFAMINEFTRPSQ